MVGSSRAARSAVNPGKEERASEESAELRLCARLFAFPIARRPWLRGEPTGGRCSGRRDVEHARSSNAAAHRHAGNGGWGWGAIASLRAAALFVTSPQSHDPSTERCTPLGSSTD